MTKVLDADTEKHEWPEAAFFMPEDRVEPSDFLEFSEKFHAEYGHLLPEGVGVVSQIGQPVDIPYRLKPPIDTLIFDARTKGTYLWQLTRGNGGSRTIWQLRGTDGHLMGQCFDINNQGSLVSNSALTVEGINQVFQSIEAMLQNQQTKTYIEEVNKAKVNAMDSLEDFAVRRTKEVESIVPVYNEPSTLQMRTIELRGKDYEEEYEKRRLIVKKVGFSALSPFESAKTRVA